MNNQSSINTAYDLPFEVSYSPGPLLSSGGSVNVECSVQDRRKFDQDTLSDVIELFAGLAQSGALAGSELQPWNSGVEISAPPDGGCFRFEKCRLDERALIVLAWKRMPSPPPPCAHSGLHKKLGWLSTIDITLTSVTGLTWYYFAFVAG